jgi:hypothetical protein
MGAPPADPPLLVVIPEFDNSATSVPSESALRRLWRFS